MRKGFFFSIAAGAGLIISAAVIAQQAGNPPNQRPNYPPPLSPDQRQHVLDAFTAARAASDAKMKVRVQNDLGVSDDEIDLIWTKFQAILAARHLDMESNAAAARNWQRLQPPLDDTTQAVVELAKAEQDPAATPAQLADLMQAVRERHRKDRADFLAAQDDLKKILNTRQEAVMMDWGILN